MIQIARPLGGVSLNEKEYVLDRDGEPMTFINEATARGYLILEGYTPEMIEAEGIMFEEVN